MGPQAKLYGVKLVGVSLAGVNLSSAFLMGVNFLNVDLRGTNLTNVNLIGAILLNVLIDETTVITRDIILEAGDWGGGTIGTTFSKNIKKWFAKCNSASQVKYV